MCKGYIYRHWLINENGIEKSYIGQTYQQTVEQRWEYNGKGYTRRSSKNSKFAKAINKYGWNNFHHDIIGIVESNTKEQLVLDLNEWEKYYIDKYDSFNNGYNSTDGGGKDRAMSFETLNRMKEVTKGDKNPNASAIICLETKQVFTTIKEAKEWCGGDISSYFMGRQKSAGKHPITGGKLHWMYLEDYNKLNPQEQQQKFDEIKNIEYKIGKVKIGQFVGDKNPNAKAVICLETLQIFTTMKEAKNWCNGDISKYLRGLTQSGGKHPITKEKLHWMYYSDYLTQQNN